MITSINEYKKYLENIDYSNTITSVIALTYNGKILILKRGSTANWMPNKWSLVGGVVENENPQDAVIRECKEEIGLIPTNVTYQNQLETGVDGIIMYYTGALESDQIILDSENSDYKFITLDELNNYDYVPYIKEYLTSHLK